MPGFVAYELLDCGNGILITVTTCHDREAAERSIELAADFVAKELEGIEIERVEATIGEVGVEPRDRRDARAHARLSAARRSEPGRPYLIILRSCPES